MTSSVVDGTSQSSISSLVENKESSIRNLFDIHQASMENVFIGISGIIGAGKTMLATALAKQLSIPVYYEPVTDNVYLADFYRDTKTYGFAMQIYLLNARFKQQQEIIWQGRGGVQDRTIYEDSVFARMLCESGAMDKRDYTTYVSLFANMSNFMKKPNVIVHLDVSLERSMERIKTRARGVETGITIDYLRALHAAYEVFIREISRIIPVIRVNYETFPTPEAMAESIAYQYTSMTNIRLVDFQSSTTSPPSSSSTSPLPSSAPLLSSAPLPSSTPLPLPTS